MADFRRLQARIVWTPVGTLVIDFGLPQGEGTYIEAELTVPDAPVEWMEACGDTFKHWETASPLKEAILAERKRLAAKIRGMIRGQPKRYSWAQQNINSGHDQACYEIARMIEEEK